MFGEWWDGRCVALEKGEGDFVPVEMVGEKGADATWS
jgi:hypothetical protein